MFAVTVCPLTSVVLYSWWPTCFIDVFGFNHSLWKQSSCSLCRQDVVGNLPSSLNKTQSAYPIALTVTKSCSKQKTIKQNHVLVFQTKISIHVQHTMELVKRLINIQKISKT